MFKTNSSHKLDELQPSRVKSQDCLRVDLQSTWVTKGSSGFTLTDRRDSHVWLQAYILKLSTVPCCPCLPNSIPYTPPIAKTEIARLSFHLLRHTSGTLQVKRYVFQTIAENLLVLTVGLLKIACCSWYPKRIRTLLVAAVVINCYIICRLYDPFLV